MFKMTKAIYAALKQNEDLKVFTEEDENSSHVWLQFGIKNGGTYKILFISSDNDNDVSVRVFSLLSVEEEQQAKVLLAINMLNSKYRFVKFVLDDDGDVNLEYDYLVHDPDPAASAEEILYRIVNLVDDVYPVLMRAIFA